MLDFSSQMPFHFCIFTLCSLSGMGGGHKMEYCDCLCQKWCKKPMVAEKIEMSSNFSSCIFKTYLSKSWLQLREIAQVVQFV